MKKDLKQAQVFTPKSVTNEMLNLFDQQIFSEDNTFFFEPTCGNGEMLVVILERIYQQLLKKYKDETQALADTLFKFYAIELDESLVVEARTKIFVWIREKKETLTDFEAYLVARLLQQNIEHKDFFEVMESSNISGSYFSKKIKKKIKI